MAQIIDDDVDKTRLQSDRYTEVRTPAFLGGSIDPVTKNLTPGTQIQTTTGTPTIESPVTDPAKPTTRLASVGETQNKSIYASIGDPMGILGGAGDTLGRAALNPLSLTGSKTLSKIGDPLGIFCHVAGTKVRMEDGSLKNIEDIRMGERVLLGGEVVGRGECLGADLHEYLGTIVQGGHAVFEEGVWTRVRDARHAIKDAAPDGTLVYPLVTENSLMVLEQYVAADFAEMADAYHLNDAGRIDLLNAAEARNRMISDFIKEHFGVRRAA